MHFAMADAWAKCGRQRPCVQVVLGLMCRACHSRQIPKCGVEVSSRVQVYPMFGFSKDCFFRIAG